MRHRLDQYLLDDSANWSYLLYHVASKNEWYCHAARAEARKENRSNLADHVNQTDSGFPGFVPVANGLVTGR